VVGGQWSVVSGQWSVVSGQWSVVGGRWSVVSGGVSDVWLRVAGQLCFVCVGVAERVWVECGCGVCGGSSEYFVDQL